jgi:GT2 family glycosyltransferase
MTDPFRPVWVLPMLKPEWASETIGSIRGSIVETQLVVVDNSVDGLDPLLAKRVFQYVRTGVNLGCSASWNVGRAWALRLKTPLVICSEAVVFRDGGVCAQTMAANTDFRTAHRARQAWHLLALHNETLRIVGPFDEGFWPIYFEDTDYEYRMRLRSFRMRVHDLDESYSDKGHARSWRDGWVDVEYPRQEAYYRAKWGGDPEKETFVFPFGVDPGIHGEG